jgi:hypothetical protein
MFLRFFVFLATCLAAGRTAGADVLVVGGGNYQTVQEAVNVAHDGDVVLVYANVNNENVVVSKGIAIVADVPTRLTWIGALQIQNVPAGRTVLISGFNLGIPSSLSISDNAGSIRIQDCLVATTSVPFTPPLIAVVCSASRDVAFLHSSIGGGSGVNGPNGAAGISASGSKLTIDDCQVHGGAGRVGAINDHGVEFPGGAGGDAILLAGGELVLQSSSVQGGPGGAGWVGNCSGFPATAGGAGGDGVVLSAGALAHAVGGTTVGGSGGLGGVNACNQAPDGAHGLAFNAIDGTWSESAGPNRAFVVPRIVREGQPLVLAISGAPSEHAFVALSRAAASIDARALDGVWLQTPSRRLDLGMLDSQGMLSITLTTPDLPSGMTNDLMHLQSVLVGASGDARLGCAGVVVRVGAGY